MKKRSLLVMFTFTLFVSVFMISGCDDINNPVVDRWWHGEPDDGGSDDDGSGSGGYGGGGYGGGGYDGGGESGNGDYPFQQETFVVSFDSGGGNYVDSINGNSPGAAPQVVWAHAHASVPGLVINGSSFFNGWWYEGAEWDFAVDTVEENMTLVAQWAPTGHKVTFDINFDSVVSGITDADEKANMTYVPEDELIADGALAAEPLHFGLNDDSSYAADYVFTGWYDAETGGAKWDFATMTVTGMDRELYGGWVDIDDPTVYTVRFVSDADKNPPPDQHVLDSEPVIDPYVTYRDGYSFGGWYKDAACTDDWVFNTDKADSANDALFGATDNIITLYAKWAPVAEVDILKDVDIVDFRYILFSGGQTVFNDPAAPGSSTNLTAYEKSVNDDEIDAIIRCLNANPHYRVMVVGHANPATEADKADPLNVELMRISEGRADAVKAELLNPTRTTPLNSQQLPQYSDTGATPIVAKGEGGRRALENPMLSRRVEIIVFDIITKTVTQ